ncbi:galactonate oxidoreductase, partial [Klebsiella pneumoniae]|nr:galactonate oxidoreductase [Klebsiella pneumoniae]
KVTARMMLTHSYDFKSLAEIYESDVINNRQLIKGVIHF